MTRSSSAVTDPDGIWTSAFLMKLWSATHPANTNQHRGPVMVQMVFTSVISLSIRIWLMTVRWHIMTFSSWAEHFPQAVSSVFCPVWITPGSDGRWNCREAPWSAACSAVVSIFTSLLFCPHAAHKSDMSVSGRGGIYEKQRQNKHVL